MLLGMVGGAHHAVSCLLVSSTCVSLSPRTDPVCLSNPRAGLPRLLPPPPPAPAPSRPPRLPASLSLQSVPLTSNKSGPYYCLVSLLFASFGMLLEAWLLMAVYTSSVLYL